MLIFGNRNLLVDGAAIVLWRPRRHCEPLSQTAEIKRSHEELAILVEYQRAKQSESPDKKPSFSCPFLAHRELMNARVRMVKSWHEKKQPRG